ncbi:hypothetical protein NHX12_018717 [Muraenolepis orangiensis]|uniref:Coiled-coil domain-containing protein 40 n=1 Tax=Muraenolepis orangiensis TaxID=630683 RepID=A0A9Q0EXA9_9TELE|nr:hypothetical protein NHX12_018717 [Muraenolepis orangiensis]
MDRYSEERDAMEPFLGHDPSYAPEYMYSSGDQSDGEEQNDPGTHDEQDYGDDDLMSPSEEGREEEEEEEEEEDEMMVLDHEHPKVRRFQKNLKVMLNRQLDRINMDLKDKRVLMKAENRAKQDLGEEVHRVHEELVRLHTNLEDHHRTNARTALEGQQAQEELEAIRSEYRDKAGKADKERSHMSQLQAEIAQVMRHLSYMQEVNSEMCSDIGAMGNADRKAQAEKSQAEEHKYKQDLYVDRLTKDLERITEQTASYEAQIAARKRETQAATEALSEREEDSYRKSITKEQERNEMLTVQLKRHQMEAATYSKRIGQSQAEQEALQAQYSTYGRTLYETQCSLAKLNLECGTQQAELSGLKKHLEKESGVRVEMEDKILSRMQQELTHDMAAKYTRRLAGKMAALKKERMCQLWKLEAEVADAALESAEVSLCTDVLTKEQDALETQISERDEVLAASQAAVTGCDTTMERKQATINGYNKKIQQITASTNAEQSPLQMQAQALDRQLEELEATIKEKQQLWMWHQGQMVALIQERQANWEKNHRLQTQHTILQQRTIRTKSEMVVEQRDQAELDKRTKMLRGEMLKLNSLISNKGQLRHALDQDNALMEMHFIHKLKDAERESVEMQMRLEKIQEEKERLIYSRVEAERQIMLWEKKSQLARDTRSIVDVDQGDIRAMKAEIHRMEVRLGQLRQQQERQMRESEATVIRREPLLQRMDAATSYSKPQTNTFSKLYLRINGLRRSLQDTHKKALESEQRNKELQEIKLQLSAGLSQKNHELSELRRTNADMTSDLLNLQDTKERTLSRLLFLQGRCKRLQALRDGSYVPLSTADTVEEALQRQTERAHSMTAILHRVCGESPEHQGALRGLIHTMAAFGQTVSRVQENPPPVSG